jgi:VIT1/CCC1 family predicted Fe2+/Mn2+ transporter
VVVRAHGVGKARFRLPAARQIKKRQRGIAQRVLFCYNTSMNQEYLDRARNELTEHYVYANLARREKNPENRALLEKLSAQEKSHYEFWKSLLEDENKNHVAINPHPLSLYGIPMLRTIFGVTFTTKFLETHEKTAIETYEKMAAAIPEKHRARLREVIEDEKTHEQSFIGALREKRVAYVGFIALGLADAIVEITGVHAGFLGVTGSTLVTGVSGIIVGFAAAISMGSASYLQAKQDTDKSAIISAFATGLSYLGSVILLALPYFLIRTMIVAFIVSTSVGLALLATFTFYSAILFDRKFSREFGEAATLMLGTALATYILGTVVGGLFHLNSGSF